MTNVFNLIKNSILHNYTPTYGDLINENKQEVFNHAIHNICSDDEFNEYLMIEASDKKRLLSSITNSTSPQINKKTQLSKQQTIAGIGEVIQIC